MAKTKEPSDETKEPSDENQAMTPKMRDLIERFDPKDRRDPEQATRHGATKKRRRRGDPPAAAA
jgi:hypothetical protein